MLLLAVSAKIVCYGFMNETKKSLQTANITNKGFAVVELFTSEGCSSCPSADETIGRLLAENNPGVFILSYHVDYWNRLGWKDEFSRPSYSARQQQYARSLSLEGVYTPQVIVNGAVEFVGSNESILNSTVNAGLKNGTSSNLNITATKTGNAVAINYTLTASDPMLLNVAFVLPRATTQVKRGENGGKTLNHVNIVAGLKVIEVKASGNLKMDIPKEIMNKAFKVIAYTQNKQSFKIVGVDEVDL